MTQPTARARGWVADHAVEIVFAVLVAVAFGYTVRITAKFYFFADDWLVLRQAASISRFLDPYNNSLSVISMVLDRGLVEMFGLHYTALRVFGLLCLYAVPTAYFFTARRQLTPFVAAVFALPLVWYGSHSSFFPGEYNHNVALLGAVIGAAALNRGRRADVVLAVAVAVSLGAAGGGVVVVGACLVHNACTRAPLRRWLAVLVPAAAYLVWWLVAVGEGTRLGPLALTTSQTIRLIRDLAYAAFETFALGNVVVTWLLIAAFVVYAIWSLSRGLDHGANVAAWSVAVVLWGFGLAKSRGVLADPMIFRYRYTALALVLLAIVPRRPIPWPSRLRSDVRRWSVVAAAVLLVLGGARALAVRGDMQDAAAQLTRPGQVDRATAAVVALGPAVVADRVVLPFGLGGLDARGLRSLFAIYGAPSSATGATVDRDIVATGVLQPRTGRAGSGPCAPLTGPFRYRPPGINEPVLHHEVLRSRRGPVVVSVRRFGRAWVPLAVCAAGRSLDFVLPSLASTVPWEVRADGACRGS